jgi:hypothetical protein
MTASAPPNLEGNIIKPDLGQQSSPAVKPIQATVDDAARNSHVDSKPSMPIRKAYVAASDYGYEQATPAATANRHGYECEDASSYNSDSNHTDENDAVRDAKPAMPRRTADAFSETGHQTEGKEAARDAKPAMPIRKAIVAAYEDADSVTFNKYGHARDDAHPAKKCDDDSTKLSRQSSSRSLFRPKTQSRRGVSRSTSIGTFFRSTVNKHGHECDEASPAKKSDDDSTKLPRTSSARSLYKPKTQSRRGVSRRNSLRKFLRATVNKYGYEDASPNKKYDYDSTKMPQRSSLKSIKSPTREISRRASIGTTRWDSERRIVRGRRSITFEEKSEVNHVASISSLAPPFELWFQKDEFRIMRADRKLLTDKLLRGEKLRDGDDIRGLEKYTDPTSFTKIKKVALDSVMQEQNIQLASGRFDDERISDAYQQSTAQGTNQAEERAAKDAKDIEDYLVTPRTRRLMSRSSCTW